MHINADSLIDLGKYYVRYPNGDFVFYLYKTDIQEENVDIQISLTEHQAYCICPLLEVTELPLSPGIDECIEIAVQSSFNSTVGKL